MNIVFAFLVFLGVYVAGGQFKPFEAHTQIIGSVDKGSQLEELGITPGDKILSMDGRPYKSFKDAFMAGMLKQKKSVDVVFQKKDGEQVNATINLYSPKKESLLRRVQDEWRTMGVLSSANYLVSGGLSEEGKKFSPLKESQKPTPYLSLVKPLERSF